MRTELDKTVDSVETLMEDFTLEPKSRHNKPGNSVYRNRSISNIEIMTVSIFFVFDLKCRIPIFCSKMKLTSFYYHRHKKTGSFEKKKFLFWVNLLIFHLPNANFKLRKNQKYRGPTV